MRDIVSNIHVSQPLNPILSTSTRTSSGVDRQGFNGVLLVMQFGATLDTINGSNYWTAKIQHSDDNSSYSDAAADDVQGGVVSYVVNSLSLDETLYKFPYKGSKRYTRLVCTTTGTHVNGTPLAVFAVKSDPSSAPVA